MTIILEHFTLFISILYIILGFIFGYYAKQIGYKKYFGNTFFLGFFLHIIGIILLLLIPKKKKEDFIKHNELMLKENVITQKTYDLRMKEIEKIENKINAKK